ncbi:MAG: glycosyltransferase [Chlorobiales bacterium]|nr:glycosyltransferase [Chlorobiales bacterium]
MLLVMTKKWHGRLSNDTSCGPQKFHVGLTPRVGGIAIFLGLIVAWKFSPKPMSQLLGSMLIAGLPVFASGITEDISKNVSPLKRLLASMVTGAAAWALTGYSLNHLEIVGVDYLLAFLPVSILFTAFAVAGVTNAINIIDGFNGLAGGTLMICFAALGYIAWHVGDYQLAQLCLTFIVVLNGFMLFNYPFGKIFMGDGGAYLLGFILAWVAVMLPMRNPQVSVWAPMLVCCYPVNEAVFSMGRRFWKKSHLHEPDSSHLHSMIKIKIIRPNLGHLQGYIRNSLVAPFCWAYALLFASIAIFIHDQTGLLMIVCLGSFALYSLIYWGISRINVKEIVATRVDGRIASTEY